MNYFFQIGLTIEKLFVTSSLPLGYDYDHIDACPVRSFQDVPVLSGIDHLVFFTDNLLGQLLIYPSRHSINLPAEIKLTIGDNNYIFLK